MGVALQKVVEKMDLRNLTPDVDVSSRVVNIPNVNRPALQLTGYFEQRRLSSCIRKNVMSIRKNTL